MFLLAEYMNHQYLFLLFLWCSTVYEAGAQPPVKSLVQFKKHVVSARFVSEGVAVADVNRDGRKDIMAGAYWFEAPSWKQHVLHNDTSDAPNGYSSSFLNFSLDVNNDGWIDLLRFAVPGGVCRWYENPKKSGNTIWKGHTILEKAGIESPAFVDVDGDGRKDIICNDITSQQVVWLRAPLLKKDTSWQKFVISDHPGRATHQFTHGLGWGDINGDGINDVIIRTGWWEGAADKTTSHWKFHEANLGDDCANMFVIDADKDGDADVVSSSAHRFGLWWHEQTPGGWITHEISKLFSQSHALAMNDINGDGQPDLISGKRYLAHLKGDPGTDDPSVLYWFEYQPGKQPQWMAHQVDDDSGIGNNFVVEDINGDKLPDIIISNKKGVFFFEQKR